MAQNPKLDSLLVLLQKDQPDTNKLIHLYALSDECEVSGNYEEGLKYGNQGLELADKIIFRTSSGEKEVAFARNQKGKLFTNIGIIYYDEGNYSEALKNYFACLKLYEATRNKKGIAACYNNVGNIYDNQGNSTEALNYFMSCLKLMQEIRDQKGIAASLNNIGNIYADLFEFHLSLKNLQESLRIRQAICDKAGIADSYNNIGAVYEMMAAKEMNGKLRSTILEESLKSYMASLKLNLEIGNTTGVAASYVNIGNILSRQKKYPAAKEYFLKGRTLATQIGYKEYLRDIYRGLALLDSIRGDFKNAYNNTKLFYAFRDSLDNEETRKSTIETKLTYDFEKKQAIATTEHKKELEKQQALAEEKERRQRSILLIVSGFLFLVLILAGFILRSLRITRRQKSVIQDQKQLVEEKQKEIIDSITYARRIQNSLLTTEKYIDDSIRRLKQ